jgi:hypothetical protein
MREEALTDLPLLQNLHLSGSASLETEVCLYFHMYAVMSVCVRKRVIHVCVRVF